MHVTLHELEKKFRDVSHTANLNIKERENAYEAERNKLTYKIAELTEETNKKALDRERQLREEAQVKFTLMEKVSILKVRMLENIISPFFQVIMLNLNSKHCNIS